MKLAEYLKLDRPLPDDPFEALIAVRAWKMRLAERVTAIMGAAYPDWDACIDKIEAFEDVLMKRLQTQEGGEA